MDMSGFITANLITQAPLLKFYSKFAAFQYYVVIWIIFSVHTLVGCLDRVGGCDLLCSHIHVVSSQLDLERQRGGNF